MAAPAIVIDVSGRWLGSEIFAAMLYPDDPERRAQMHATNAARNLDRADRGALRQDAHRIMARAFGEEIRAIAEQFGVTTATWRWPTCGGCAPWRRASGSSRPCM